METNKAKFWLGLGLGSVVGALAICFSRTEKAKEWKEKACCAVDKMVHRAGDAAERAKEKALDAGSKAADKVSDMAHNAADKTDVLKGRVHNAADAARR